MVPGRVSSVLDACPHPGLVNRSDLEPPLSEAIYIIPPLPLSRDHPRGVLQTVRRNKVYVSRKSVYADNFDIK